MISATAAADPPDYDRARAVARFDGVMRALVHDLKFRDRHDSRRLFGRWLAEAGAELLAGADVLMPVPLTRVRLIDPPFQPGRDPGARGCAANRHLLSVPWRCSAHGAHRRRWAEPRAAPPERRRRLRRAAPRGRIAGRSVVLIDDVITTGATAGACARVLKRAGAARVDVLALALVTDARRRWRLSHIAENCRFSVCGAIRHICGDSKTH